MDIEQSYRVLKYLQNLTSQSTGIIFVSHALKFVKKISDKIIFIDNGEIIESGSGRILTNPQTARLKTFINIF